MHLYSRSLFPLETRVTPRAALASLTNLRARLIKKIIAVISEDEISRKKEIDRPRFPPIVRNTWSRNQRRRLRGPEIGETERKLIEFVPDVGPFYRREYRKR